VTETVTHVPWEYVPTRVNKGHERALARVSAGQGLVVVGVSDGT
jgi:hypothetical protein